jgi:hypothetical protein
MAHCVAASATLKHALCCAESAKEKPLVGVVVAAGPGKEKEEMKLAVGDKVVYFKYAGDKMMVRSRLPLRAFVLSAAQPRALAPRARRLRRLCAYRRTTRARSTWCCTSPTCWASSEACRPHRCIATARAARQTL